MKGAANDVHSSRGGIYILGSNQVNGKVHWIQEGGLNALWYDNKNWKIGLIKNIGSGICGIYSKDNSVWPHENTSWKYMKDGKWIETTDLIILSVPGTYFQNLF